MENTTVKSGNLVDNRPLVPPIIESSHEYPEVFVIIDVDNCITTDLKNPHQNARKK